MVSPVPSPPSPPTPPSKEVVNEVKNALLQEMMHRGLLNEAGMNVANNELSMNPMMETMPPTPSMTDPVPGSMGPMSPMSIDSMPPSSENMPMSNPEMNQGNVPGEPGFSPDNMISELAKQAGQSPNEPMGSSADMGGVFKDKDPDKSHSDSDHRKGNNSADKERPKSTKDAKSDSDQSDTKPKVVESSNSETSKNENPQDHPQPLHKQKYKSMSAEDLVKHPYIAYVLHRVNKQPIVSNSFNEHPRVNAENSQGHQTQGGDTEHRFQDDIESTPTQGAPQSNMEHHRRPDNGHEQDTPVVPPPSNLHRIHQLRRPYVSSSAPLHNYASNHRPLANSAHHAPSTDQSHGGGGTVSSQGTVLFDMGHSLTHGRPHIQQTALVTQQQGEQEEHHSEDLIHNTMADDNSQHKVHLVSLFPSLDTSHTAVGFTGDHSQHTYFMDDPGVKG